MDLLEPSASTLLVSEALAEFVDALTIDKIPPHVVNRARHLFLDGIGIALAASGFEFARQCLAAIRELAEPGEQLVIGAEHGLPMRDAALMNGILVHGLDYDDTHSAGVVHPTASVLPTVLAAGARSGASGAEILAAYIAGLEVAARIGMVANGAFHLIGFHPTGVVGTFACALAAGKLLGLNVQQLVMAQGIALSAAAGTLECLEEGAWTKRFQGGWPAVAGLTAAGLAKHGFTGPRRSYEGRFGLYATHLQQRYNAGSLPRAVAGLGAQWETMQVAIKPFPACHLVHACADAALTLRAAHALVPERIAQIIALVPREAINSSANRRRTSSARPIPMRRNSRWRSW